MAPNFQSSFIPKQTSEQQVFQKKNIGFLGFLVVLLFILSIISGVGVYIYKGVLKNDIADLEQQLADAERGIDKDTIEQMSQFGKKLDLTKSIISKHQVISGFLEYLASSTVSTVYFANFSYGDLNNGELTVNVDGRATDYASIALQEDVFSKSEYVKSMSFSGLSLSEKGQVSFDLSLSIDQKVSNYSITEKTQ